MSEASSGSESLSQEQINELFRLPTLAECQALKDEMHRHGGGAVYVDRAETSAPEAALMNWPMSGEEKKILEQALREELSRELTPELIAEIAKEFEKMNVNLDFVPDRTTPRVGNYLDYSPPRQSFGRRILSLFSRKHKTIDEG